MVGNVFFASSAFVQLSPSSSASCQSSSICTATPQWLEMIMDFVREILGTIRTQAPAWYSLGTYVHPNWYQGHDFVPPSQTVLGNLKTNIQQKLIFSATLSILLLRSAAWFSDVLWQFLLLFKHGVFLRDVGLVDALEQELINKYYEVGLWWALFSHINDQNLALMNEVIDTYVRRGVLSPWSSFAQWTTYQDVLVSLYAILSSTKTFLYLDKNLDLSISQSFIKLYFVPSFLESLQAEYTCIRWFTNPCDPQLQKITSAFGTVFLDFSSSWKRSFAVLTWSISRLQETFSRQQSQTFKEREQELLHTLYGTTISDSVRLSNPFTITTQNISPKDSYLSPSWKWFLQSSPRQRIEDAHLPATPQVSLVMIEDKQFVRILNGYMTDVFVSHDLDIQQSMLVETKVITPLFAYLGDFIFRLKDYVVGNLSVEWSLVYNLARAARLQCSQ